MVVSNPFDESSAFAQEKALISPREPWSDTKEMFRWLENNDDAVFGTASRLAAESGLPLSKRDESFNVLVHMVQVAWEEILAAELRWRSFDLNDLPAEEPAFEPVQFKPSGCMISLASEADFALLSSARAKNFSAASRSLRSFEIWPTVLSTLMSNLSGERCSERVVPVSNDGRPYDSRP